MEKADCFFGGAKPKVRVGRWASWCSVGLEFWVFKPSACRWQRFYEEKDGKGQWYSMDQDKGTMQKGSQFVWTHLKMLSIQVQWPHSVEEILWPQNFRGLQQIRL